MSQHSTSFALHKYLEILFFVCRVALIKTSFVCRVQFHNNIVFPAKAEDLSFPANFRLKLCLRIFVEYDYSV